jgi:AP-3 complex subunit beta
MNKIGLDNASYFETNGAKLGEIKAQLDSQSDKDKLEGMKRLIAMISKGRDVSALFADVVKNVVCKHLEVKKLVYMYLTHYAELEPESVLLAINTFQKAMSDQNQLIRASALRVMSSIRVLDIVQLIVMAIEKAMKDSSAYVRKAAAHAITKVYRLDPEKKEQLIGIIKVLLADTSTMVLGSAVAAFMEVSPDHIELIHPHYRKLCRVLADVDEWGQIFIINLLIRYGRAQFTCPDPALLETNGKHVQTKEKAFYGSDDDDEGSSQGGKGDLVSLPDLDPDHRLLLKSAQPLLQSRNNGVVMAVASLYYYLAPTMEASKVGKSLVRILRANREVQYVVLSNIASMSATRPGMFEQHLSEFFVDAGDPEFTRALKLEVLTNIANESNISRILREFKEYVKSEDKAFVTATIQAIGRCASRIEEVTSSCMQGLMALMSNPAEAVIGESVVVIKTLLQLGAKESTPAQARRHRAIIRHLARLLDTIKVPMARASIAWLVGEYASVIPTIAPDIFRKLAKSFREEQDITKMQILNLGAKLHLTNSEQTTPIFLYVLDLAKFDMNYDIRDRARLMRVILLDKDNKVPSLHAHAKELFVNQKPAPSISNTSDRQRFMLGSLSHVVNHSTLGYQALPDFPEVAPDPSVRNPNEEKWDLSSNALQSPRAKKEKFWSDDESGSAYSSDEGYYEKYSDDDRSDSALPPKKKKDTFYSDDDYSDDKYSDKYSDDDYSDDYYSDDYDDGEQLPPTKPAASKPSPAKPTTNKATNGSSNKPPAKPTSAPAKKPQAKGVPDLDDLFGLGPTSTSSASNLSNDLAGLNLSAGGTSPPRTHNAGFASLSFTPSNTTPRKILLKSVVGGGLEIEYSFLRRGSVHGLQVNTILLYFKNLSDRPITNIKTGKLNLGVGMSLIPFSEIKELAPGTSTEQTISVTFINATQPAKFEILHERGAYNVTLPPSIGDLVLPCELTLAEFAEHQKKLGGMHESSDSISVTKENLSNVVRNVLTTAYLANIPTGQEGKYKFAGRTLADQAIILVTIDLNEDGIGKCSVSSENTILGGLLRKTLVEELIRD